jgi:hypothetical protein
MQAATLLRLNQSAIPYIATLLDAGELPTGVPYLAATPVGFPVTFGIEPVRVLELGRDAARASQSMYQQLQVGAGNIPRHAARPCYMSCSMLPGQYRMLVKSSMMRMTTFVHV